MNEHNTSLVFSSRIEHYLGEKLALRYAQNWPLYHNWYKHAPERISAVQGREMLGRYMPELLFCYDALCHAFGADEETCAFLSLYKPPVFRSGCSQAGINRHNIELVRNYDFPAKLCDRLLLHTNWNGTRVIAMTDCLWGVIDGMNEHGLAVSLAYGGRAKHGDGFAVTLVLRYILEFCQSTAAAVEVLSRVPIHMPYNITLVDASGDIKTVTICPGEKVQIATTPFATNHQQGGEIIDLEAIADSYTREQFLSCRLSDPHQYESPLVDLFLQPPLLRNASQWHGWGTLYTVCYKPSSKSIELHWPNKQILKQSFDNFIETDLCVTSPAYN